MNESIRRHLSRHYDEKYARQSGPPPEILIRRYPRDRFEAAIKWAGTGKRLLEIGAGSGNIVNVLRTNYKECVATEISSPRVSALKTNFSDDPKVQILPHNIESENLPFPAEYFDTILLIDVIEHLIDPIPALIEIYRVLKHGGKLLVHTPNVAKWTRRAKLLFGYFPSTASMDEGLAQYKGKGRTNLYDEGHLHYFTYRSLSRLLVERAGFSKIIRHGYGRYGPLCAIWSTMMSDVLVTAIK